MARKVTPKSTLKKPVVRIPKQKTQKPVFGIGTLVVLVLFGFSVLGVLYVNRQKESASAETTSPVEQTESFIFENRDVIVSDIEIKTAGGESVKLARDEKNEWALVGTENVAADQGSAEAAASQALALKTTALLESADLKIFGLEKPAYTIDLTFTSGEKHTIEVGDATPTNSGYYIRVDKGQVAISDLNGIDALVQLVEFPPYAATPAP